MTNETAVMTNETAVITKETAVMTKDAAVMTNEATFMTNIIHPRLDRGSMPSVFSRPTRSGGYPVLFSHKT